MADIAGINDLLYKQLLKESSLAELSERLPQAGTTSIHVSDRFDPFLIFLIWMTFKDSALESDPLVILSGEVETTDELASALRTLLPHLSISVMPPWDTFFYEAYSPSVEIVGDRNRILRELQCGGIDILLIPARSLIQKVPSKEELSSVNILKIDKAGEDSPDRIAEKLIRMGYLRVPLVEEQGQFGIRGFILDIFPSTGDRPVRLEFFGDEIERMAYFDTAGQRSADDISEIVIYPSEEYTMDAARRSKIRKQIEAGKTLVASELEDLLSEIELGGQVNGLERFVPTAGIEQSSILDHLPKGSKLIMLTAERFKDLIERIHEGLLEGVEEAVQLKLAPEECRAYISAPDELFSKIGDFNSLVKFYDLGGAAEDGEQIAPSGEIDLETGAIIINASMPPSFNNNFPELSEFIKANKQTQKLILQTHDDGQKRRLQEILSREDIHVETVDHINGNPFAYSGKIGMGFRLEEAGLTFLGLRDLFGKFADQSSSRKKSSGRKVILSDLEPGDLVVHENYGLARFEGLNYIEVGEATWECLDLKFKDGNLKVRTDSISEITKYIGNEDANPTLSSLSSNVWAKTKVKARTSVRKLAIDLVKLYAERVSHKGRSFSADNIWQQEMEDSFPFEETDDQLTAVHDIKRDMESDKPMDRLLCGDVGFGKTEVAVRSAFKAALDGMQVIIFVPTTILAKQHFETFNQRYMSFPVRVEMLSRFRTAKEQKKIISDFSMGKIDVLIGTHRLLSKDLVPHDLGLVIIDEEQRFGVEAKEKLKLIKKGVDVLMMSATPIPRTLQMSLGGIRDLSQINTAPQDRRPIQTFVSEYNEEITINAIKRELRRGGQVFYVHNNIEKIGVVAGGITSRLPQARVEVAHGKMDSRKLEDIILRFSNREIDVLVATTIIESGIDIPNANTLIVSDSEKLGLAQAYQLRGRVGRSSERAFAYFFYTKDKLMLSKAYHRLKTLREHSGLNSGLKIALKDLEIRGAGNLLGGEQHGRIAEVGFELYSQMLAQEINTLKDEPEEVTPDVGVILPVDAVIPVSYIEEPSVRIEIYRAMNATRNDDRLSDLKNELKDRFGKVPTEVRALLEVISIKYKAASIGVKMINWDRDDLTISPLDLERDEVKGIIKAAIPDVLLNATYNKSLGTLKINNVPKDKASLYCLATLQELIKRENEE